MTTAARVLDRATLAALVLLFVGGARAGALREPIEDAARRNFAEYLELLRYRNVADVPADIQRNAEFLRQAFERRGLRARLVSNAAGRPVVLAQMAGAAPGLPTLLFYIHYDGQPVTAAEWSQPDPFEPVVRLRAGAGEWQDVERRRAAGETAEPGAARVRTLRVGRQSADHDAADGARPARRAKDGAGVRRQGHARRRGGDGLAEPRGHDRGRPGGVSRRRARHSRRAAARVRPADDRVRQSRHRANEAHGLRPARAAA